MFHTFEGFENLVPQLRLRDGSASSPLGGESPPFGRAPHAGIGKSNAMVRNHARRVDGTRRPISAIIQIRVLPEGTFSSYYL